jgi:hypothetical protein
MDIDEIAVEIIKKGTMFTVAESNLDVIYQNPYELAAMCKFLLDKGISKYLEVGLANGGLLKFITEFFNLSVSNGIDLAMPVSKAINSNIFIGNSTSSDAVSWAKKYSPYDLIFIDAGHDYESVKADYINYNTLGRFVAFHDILGLRNTPGVARLWNEVKIGRKYIEFIDTSKRYSCGPPGSYDTEVGIGLLIEE